MPVAVSTLVVPCDGGVVTATLAGTNGTPGFPGASLAKVGKVTAVLTGVVVISTLATGALSFLDLIPLSLSLHTRYHHLGVTDRNLETYTRLVYRL